MLKAIFDWFRQPSPKAFAPAVQPEAAPYKVEKPVQVAPVLEAQPVKPAPNTTTARKSTPKPAAARLTTKKTTARKPTTKKP